MGGGTHRTWPIAPPARCRIPVSPRPTEHIPMGHRTPLHEQHLAAGARMVDFGGWDMPINYGSQIAEHNAVRAACGVFDVSHMTVIDVVGSGARDFLRHLLTNDVDRLQPDGKAMYSLMCREDGGVIDDLIVYRMSFAKAPGFRLVTNCGTRSKDLAWLAEQAAPFSVDIRERADLAILAVQGPQAIGKVCALLPDAAKKIRALENFSGFAPEQATHGDWYIARTGYTGEDGVEIILPNSSVVDFWNKLLAAGVTPAGLAARDTLRLEAGMHLYGNDMDESVSPLAAGLGWTIAWEPATRDFIGRAALATQRAAGVAQKFVGLLMTGKGVLRGHQKVIVDGSNTLEESGEITSGTFSPTLGYSIALARVPAAAGSTAKVDMRGKLVDVQVVKPPFVRHGKQVFKI